MIFLLGSTALTAPLYSKEILIADANQYQAFALTPEVLNIAGTSSLRVVNRATGEETPYFIFSPLYIEELDVREVYVPFTFLRSAAYEDYYHLDFEAVAVANRDTIINQLQLTSTQTEFLKNIQVLGSYDGQNWYIVTHNALVYAVGDIYQNKIVLGDELRFSFYRLQVYIPQDWVDFQLSGLHRQYLTERVPYIAAKTAAAQATFYVESEGGVTTVTLTGLDNTSMQNLRIYYIDIQTDSFFKRSVRVANDSTITLYRLFFQDKTLVNTTIPLHGRPHQSKQLSFTIADYDDRPIDIQEIWVEYAQDYVVFRAEAGQEYSLHFGGGLTRPRYDIENFRDLIIQEGFGLAELQGVAVLLDEFEDVGERDFTLIFNIAIAIAGVLLIAVALLGVRRSRASS